MEESLDRLFSFYRVRTLSNLAEKMGVAQPTLSKWKHANSFSLLEKKCKELGIYEEIFSPRATESSFARDAKDDYIKQKYIEAGDSAFFLEFLYESLQKLKAGEGPAGRRLQVRLPHNPTPHFFREHLLLSIHGYDGYWASEEDKAREATLKGKPEQHHSLFLRNVDDSMLKLLVDTCLQSSSLQQVLSTFGYIEKDHLKHFIKEPLFSEKEEGVTSQVATKVKFS